MLFDKRNYLLMGIAVLLIVLGLLLMSGGKSPDGITFNPDIFSLRRIRVAPAVMVIGFLLMIPAILLRPRKKISDNNDKA